MPDMIDRLDPGSITLGIPFLEAGAGWTVDGMVYAKTVPFGILAQAIAGRYELEHSGRRIDGPTGAAVFAPPGIPLRFIHRHDLGTDARTIRWVHFTFVVGGMNLLDLVDLP